MLKHRLQIAEYVFLVGSFIGLALAVWTGKVIYAAVPVSVALVLNLLNRIRLEQQMKRRFITGMNQLQRQLVDENYALQQQQLKLHKQQLEEAIAQAAQALVSASLNTQTPGYLAQLDSSELHQSSELQNLQFQEQLTRLEQTLNSVIEYLNSASLPSRVERLEDVTASATTEITWIHRQLTDAQHSGSNQSEAQLQAHQPEGVPTVTEPQPSSSELTNTLPVEPQTFSLLSESLPLEKSPDVLLPPQTWSLLQTLKGHSDWIHSLAISSDGQILASGSFDKTINLWYVATGELIRTLSNHSKGVLCLAISPDGQTLASGSFDETIKLWRLDTGELLDTLKGHTSSVRSLVISEDSQILISGSFDETIKLWRLDTGEFLGNLTKTAGQVCAIALSPDGQTLANGGSDGLIDLRLLDMTEGEIKPARAIALTGNLSSICSLAISPDGEILAAGCTDGTIKFWELGTLEILNVLQGHTAPVMSVVFSLDTPTLLSGSADGTIKIWHPATGQQIGMLSDDLAASVIAIAISSNGQLIASGGADCTIKIWQRD